MSLTLLTVLMFLFVELSSQIFQVEVRNDSVCAENTLCCHSSNKTFCCPNNSTCCSSGDGCCPGEPQLQLHKRKASSSVNSTTPLVIQTKLKSDKNVKRIEKPKKSSITKESWNYIFANIAYCPGRKQRCPRSFSCCLMKNNQYGCCPYTNANCCSDLFHCCPRGSKCNVTTKACVPILK